MSIDIQSPSELSLSEPSNSYELKNLVTPGEVVATSTGFMRGHGTYTEDDQLISCVSGVVEQVNKLVSVKPLKSRYGGEIGDVLIGRVSEVQQKRWKIDTNSRLDSILLLSSVNLPGGELRRKSLEDERMMRQYLQEGDLISAEVQMVFHDGALSLHTRSLKYGKLSQGILVKVWPSLVKRRKSHFHNFPCGASVILGNNGYIWVSPTLTEEESQTGGYVQNLDKIIPMEERQVIIRLRNCISLLADHRILLFDTTIMHAYEISQQYEVSDLLKAEVAAEIADEVRVRTQMENQ